MKLQKGTCKVCKVMTCRVRAGVQVCLILTSVLSITYNTALLKVQSWMTVFKELTSWGYRRVTWLQPEKILQTEQM